MNTARLELCGQDKDGEVGWGLECQAEGLSFHLKTLGIHGGCAGRTSATCEAVFLLLLRSQSKAHPEVHCSQPSLCKVFAHPLPLACLLPKYKSPGGPLLAPPSCPTSTAEIRPQGCPIFRCPTNWGEGRSGRIGLQGPRKW